MLALKTYHINNIFTLFLSDASSATYGNLQTKEEQNQEDFEWKLQ
jgi:hypothetical protein